MDAVSAGFYTGGSFRFSDANEQESRGGAAAASRCKESRGGRGPSRGQPCYEEEKRDGEGIEREDRVERRRSERTAGKIGGGSQQLLAGMSGNAWDSDPKGSSHDERPRDPWPPSVLSLSNG